MNWLSLRNNQFQFNISGELPIHLDEFTEYLKLNKEKLKDVNMYNMASVSGSYISVKIPYVFTFFLLPSCREYKDIESNVLLECLLYSLYIFPLYV